MKVVREFTNVFEEIIGPPPNREIEFHIDLIPSTPIAKSAYHLSPKQLEEMKEQLDEMLSKW